MYRITVKDLDSGKVVKSIGGLDSIQSADAWRDELEQQYPAEKFDVCCEWQQ